MLQLKKYKLIITLLVLLILSFGIRSWVVSFMLVKGPSMQPNFFEGDLVVLAKPMVLGLLNRPYEVGDVLVARPNANSKKNHDVKILKRFVGQGPGLFELTAGVWTQQGYRHEVVGLSAEQKFKEMFPDRHLDIEFGDFELIKETLGEDGRSWIILNDLFRFDCDTFGPSPIADEELVLLGDNRCYSADSRAWGPIKKSEVFGLVVLKIPLGILLGSVVR